MRLSELKELALCKTLDHSEEPALQTQYVCESMLRRMKKLNRLEMRAPAVHEIDLGKEWVMQITTQQGMRVAKLSFKICRDWFD